MSRILAIRSYNKRDGIAATLFHAQRTRTTGGKALIEATARCLGRARRGGCVCADDLRRGGRLARAAAALFRRGLRRDRARPIAGPGARSPTRSKPRWLRPDADPRARLIAYLTASFRPPIASPELLGQLCRLLEPDPQRPGDRGGADRRLWRFPQPGSKN